MAFTISQFRSQGLSQGGARPNLFQASLTNAPVTWPTDGGEGSMSFACKIAAIPASTLAAVDVPYFGRNVKVAGNRTFDALSVTIINDEEMRIRKACETWMNEMNSHVGNVQKIAQGDMFTAGLSVQHYGKDGGVLGNPWKFTNCFPIALGEIGLDWGSNDTIEEFTIEWAYDYWTHSGSTDG
jgi:hypothetical protein